MLSESFKVEILAEVLFKMFYTISLAEIGAVIIGSSPAMFWELFYYLGDSSTFGGYNLCKNYGGYEAFLSYDDESKLTGVG